MKRFHIWLMNQGHLDSLAMSIHLFRDFNLYMLFIFEASKKTHLWCFRLIIISQFFY